MKLVLFDTRSHCSVEPFFAKEYIGRFDERLHWVVDQLLSLSPTPATVPLVLLHVVPSLTQIVSLG